MLKFADKIKTTKNKYHAILRESFDGINLYNEDYCDYDGWLTIDFLDDWLEKADACVKKENCAEAALIAKACLEQLFEWLFKMNIDGGADDYAEHIFSILEKAAKKSEKGKKELYQYCLAEVPKEKYRDIQDSFYDLMLALAPDADPEGFLALQDKLFAALEDKTSWQAHKILMRKIKFYRNAHKTAAALEVIKNNLQIESFREEWVEHLIKKGELSEAKKIIYELIDNESGEKHIYRKERWDELLLKIAQKEKDLPEIRRIAFTFIEGYFEKKYYRIYKSAFASKEWPAEKEHLAALYGEKRKDIESLAAFYNAEKDMPGHYCPR
jgi:hypothetical protein